MSGVWGCMPFAFLFSGFVFDFFVVVSVLSVRRIVAPRRKCAEKCRFLILSLIILLCGDDKWDVISGGMPFTFTFSLFFVFFELVFAL